MMANFYDVDPNTINVAQFQADVINGYNIGYDLAFSYIGYFVYLPLISVVIYAILMKIPDRFDKVIITGEGKFKKMTILQLARKISLALTIASCGWLALMFYTDGAVVRLTFG